MPSLTQNITFNYITKIYDYVDDLLSQLDHQLIQDNLRVQENYFLIEPYINKISNDSQSLSQNFTNYTKLLNSNHATELVENDVVQAIAINMHSIFSTSKMLFITLKHMNKYNISDKKKFGIDAINPSSDQFELSILTKQLDIAYNLWKHVYSLFQQLSQQNILNILNLNTENNPQTQTTYIQKNSLNYLDNHS